MKQESRQIDHTGCYRLACECGNCGEVGGVWIKKGKPYTDESCHNCGCTSLRHVRDVPNKYEMITSL